ncbi:hypothetical protein K469DRAFT_303928 [Zopfia rhizophila CBS 207.26]|uniref:Uncharacterized protein n=1 Tax=Zopfia rhizophila CBS 207.26 TaxID=1314779 RepID=A0A6A6DJ76_9PEZI|nr:hypothetical protein K469DRAFT_303928 [Zopfia rhizophila CBS 207.26]
MNLKALNRAAQAAYVLGQFNACQDYLGLMVRTDVKDNPAQEMSERVKKRIELVQIGEYDFKGMLGAVENGILRLKCASFTRCTFVKSSITHDDGLFAAEPIKPWRARVRRKSFLHRR